MIIYEKSQKSKAPRANPNKLEKKNYQMSQKWHSRDSSILILRCGENSISMYFSCRCEIF